MIYRNSRRRTVLAVKSELEILFEVREYWEKELDKETYKLRQIVL